jgi:hypothetical protein
MTDNQPAVLRWRRTPNALFLKASHRSVIATVFRLRDESGFSFWTKLAGQNPAIFESEDAAIESCYQRLGM